MQAQISQVNREHRFSLSLRQLCQHWKKSGHEQKRAAGEQQKELVDHDGARTHDLLIYNARNE
jgi:predicted RNA-binding protein with RPS1 domain